MVSKLSLTGIIIIALGLIMLILGNALLPFLGRSLMPFYVTTGTATQGATINPSTTRDDLMLVRNVPPFISNLNLKASFYLSSSSDINCRATLMFEYSNRPGRSEMSWTAEEVSYQGTDNYLVTLSSSISFEASNERFNIYLKIENLGFSEINLINSRIDIIYNVPSFYIPIVLIAIGALMAIIPFIRARRAPSERKTPKVGTGWEPTLQWSGGSAKTSKEEPTTKSRFSIKSQKKQKTVATKVVRKAAPVGGTQVSCKFCGKKVSPSAFFCPNCYGKLR